MSETSPIESKRSRRIRLAAQSAVIVLGAVLLVALPLTDLLAWAKSPQGLGQSVFWAWVVALWLAVSPIVLAMLVGLTWQRGYSARREQLAAWGLIAVAVVILWDAGTSWGEIVLRPIVLAIMLWTLRPVEPTGDADSEANSSDG